MRDPERPDEPSDPSEPPPEAEKPSIATDWDEWMKRHAPDKAPPVPGGEVM